MHKVIKWLAYGPKISRGLGHDQGCPAAIAFIYHHTTLPLASFRGFGLLCGFLRKTTVEQNKDSWISLSGNKSLLGLAAMLIQYLLQLLPGESVFAECGSNRFCKTKYCTFDCYGWQFFCQVSTGREYRVLHREPDLRHFVLLPGGGSVCPHELLSAVLLNFSSIRILPVHSKSKTQFKSQPKDRLSVSIHAVTHCSILTVPERYEQIYFFQVHSEVHSHMQQNIKQPQGKWDLGPLPLSTTVPPWLVSHLSLLCGEPSCASVILGKKWACPAKKRVLCSHLTVTKRTG